MVAAVGVGLTVGCLAKQPDTGSSAEADDADQAPTRPAHCDPDDDYALDCDLPLDCLDDEDWFNDECGCGCRGSSTGAERGEDTQGEGDATEGARPGASEGEGEGEAGGGGQGEEPVELLALGASCRRSPECQGGSCVAPEEDGDWSLPDDVEGPGVCTRLCDDGCPDGWTCAEARFLYDGGGECAGGLCGTPAAVCVPAPGP